MPRWIYTFLLFLLLPWGLLRLRWRARRQPEYLQHWQERLGQYEQTPNKPVIWLHCVSVGETRASAPLVALLQKHYPDHQLLMTHATPTGRATSQQLFGNMIISAYLPYDLPFAVRSFLAHFKPVFGVLMETELWFNLIHQCHKRKIPLFLVNARLSEKSAKGYKWLGYRVEAGLEALTAIAAQTREDAERLCELGAPQAIVLGNLKFDVSAPADAPALGTALRETLGKNRPVFLAASTREGEETLILDAVAQAAIPGLLLVLVPRHPQRFDEVATLLQQRGMHYQRRSGATRSLPEDCQVFLGDSMGEMPTYYAASDLAFIGGSLLPLGGQNLIEACALGIPVLVGPHTFNFEEAVSQAILRGAAERVWDVRNLASELRRLMTDAKLRNQMGIAGKAFAEANRGATERIFRLITDSLAKKPGRR